MAPFDPYLHVIKPMLAESRETPFDSKDHIFELKWDGTRALAIVRDGLRFQNRRLNYVESRYPDLAVHTRKPAILDGEIVVMNGQLPSFEKLQERERASGKIKIEYLAKTLPATYIVFDVLYVGDKSVMGLSQMERKAILPDLVEVDDRVVQRDYIEGRGVDYYNAVIARGLEGIIAKHKETRYQVGKRSKDWVKIKKKTTLDAIICGITAGEGEREDTFGSLILGRTSRARSSTSAGSGPASPKSCGGRCSNGSLPCGKTSVRSPRSPRLMPTSASGRNPRSSSRRTSSSSRRTATCARRRSLVCGRTSDPRIAS